MVVLFAACTVFFGIVSEGWALLDLASRQTTPMSGVVLLGAVTLTFTAATGPAVRLARALLFLIRMPDDLAAEDAFRPDNHADEPANSSKEVTPADEEAPPAKPAPDKPGAT
jgi:heme A synthase